MTNAKTTPQLLEELNLDSPLLDTPLADVPDKDVETKTVSPLVGISLDI